MTVTRIDKDPEALTMTIVADFPSATVDQVWELWADPRKLERWWGPPTHPATFVEHSLVPGAFVTYFMTAPDGERYHGWWRVLTVDAPRGLTLNDGFADSEGRPLEDRPVGEMRLRLLDHEGGTRMELLSTFASLEQMEELLAMGQEEGMRQAIGQMDALLAA